MKAARWLAVPVLAVSVVACGGDGDGASTEAWCDLAEGIEAKFDTIGESFGSSADEIRALFDDITTELEDAVDAAPSQIEAAVKETQSAIADMKSLLEDADYNILDVDQAALQTAMENESVETANEEIQTFNEEECGIVPDSTEATTDSAPALGEGTAREAIATQLAAMGFTEEEANCVADKVDPALVEELGTDPSAMMDIFGECDIDITRLGQMGSGG